MNPNKSKKLGTNWICSLKLDYNNKETFNLNKDHKMGTAVEKNDRQNILLETGTNEVEILEFFLDEQSFGINVSKVKQLLPFRKEMLSEVPGYVKSLMGVLSWREFSIPLFDPNIAVGRDPIHINDRSIVVVTEFNNMLNAFLTSGVNRIHRISWNDIHPISNFLGTHTSKVTGSVNITDKEVLLLDFEQIISEVSPETQIAFDKVEEETSNLKLDREKVKLFMAEDSALIRKLMQDALITAGYSNLSAFKDGEEAYQAIKQLKYELDKSNGNIHDHIDLVITDIEMPRLDGLTLCKKIKKEMGLSNLPVIVFSSMINEQMAYKCTEVGADANLPKPQMNKLVETIDELVGKFVKNDDY